MDSQTLFARTPPVKLFFLASIPGAVGMLASALYQLIDGIFVGQILGETALIFRSITYLQGKGVTPRPGSRGPG